jgi:hypothetical protein
MEKDVRQLYGWYGGQEEEEATVRTRKRARIWLAGVHEDVERARGHIGLHLQGLARKDESQHCGAVSGLGLQHGGQHGSFPEESQPCSKQAQQAVQRSRQAMEADPTRYQEAVERIAKETGQATHIGTSAAGESKEDARGGLRVPF